MFSFFECFSAVRERCTKRRHPGTSTVDTAAVVSVSSQLGVPASSAHLVMCSLSALSGTGRLSVPLLSASQVPSITR